MIERSAISAVVVEFDHVTDSAFIYEATRGDVAGKPAQGPVDREQLARALLRGDHRVSLRNRCGERLLDQDVHAELRDAFGPETVLSRRRTQHHEIGFR